MSNKNIGKKGKNINGGNYYEIGGDRYGGGLVINVYKGNKLVFSDILDGEQDYELDGKKYPDVDKFLNAAAKKFGLSSGKAFKRIQLEEITMTKETLKERKGEDDTPAEDAKETEVKMERNGKTIMVDPDAIEDYKDRGWKLVKEGKDNPFKKKDEDEDDDEEKDDKNDLEEKWSTKMNTPKSERGKYKGKTKEELMSMLNKLKKSGPHKEGSKEFETQNELEFALRAKNDFGKVSESAVSMAVEHKPDQFAEIIRQGLFDRVRDAIDIKRTEVAANYFNAEE